MTREDLKRYRYKEIDIKSELETLKEQFTRLEGTSHVLSDMPKKHTNENYNIENYIDKKTKVESEMLEQSKIYMLELRQQLNQLKPIYATILREYYINAKSLEDVSEIVHLSYYRTCHLNGEALDEFDKLDKKFKKK